MTGDYAYTPQVWPCLLTVVLLVALAAFSWRRRTVPGARVFAVTCLIAVPWVAGAVMEVAAVDAAGKLFWFKFQAAWQLPVITALTCFVLEYAWPGRWLTRRNLVLLSIPSLLCLGMILTDSIHHLSWRGFTFADGQVAPVRGPGNLLFLAYGYGLAILALVVFAWLFVRSPRHRWPVAIMLAGAMAGRVLYTLEAAHVLPSGLPFNVPPIAVEYAMYAIALFGFRIFDPIPAARRALIAQMREGVLVLDPEGRVAGLNPAAERFFDLPEKQAMGRPIGEMLPACPTGPLADPAGAELELSLPERRQDDGGVGQEVRQYVLEISPLSDWRGLEVGRLLLLRDVTERRRAQAQILEQQLALAMLSERERLARELHDGIGQVLGYVKMQAQAARDRLAQDETAAADRDLARLIAVAQDAHADVREYILGARSATSAQPGFSPALRQYLRRFSEQYGLRTDLAAPPDWSDDVLEPTVQAQLLRIIQEALTNARKHARAHAVQVSVQLPTDHAQVTVQDDGVGFDPALLTGAEGQKYGLGFMRERAQEVGGSVEIYSAPGAGTQVLICVPRRKEQQ
jgi:signal transduction histidine kinase